MTKRALKRMVRESADVAQFDARHDDCKIRRLPVERAWSPMDNHNDDHRDQGYVKTIKPKSEGQLELMAAIDAKNLVVALGPAGTGKTYLAIAKAVEALEAGKVGRIVLSRPAVEAGETIRFLPRDPRGKLPPHPRPPYHPPSHPPSLKRGPPPVGGGAGGRQGRPYRALAPGRRGGRIHRLPARRRRGQARPLPAPALRRALRPALHEAGPRPDGGRRHRDRPRRLHARPHAQQRLRG